MEDKQIEAQPKKGFKAKLDNFFGISANGSSIKIEIIAGIATFLAMVYIFSC
ncbi:MAG: hypothetical protein L6U99_11110 [Clostridium sp.]|nr:MAG: hypothetical protein L6U99_11110 [Clostridium sp.]